MPRHDHMQWKGKADTGHKRASTQAYTYQQRQNACPDLSALHAQAKLQRNCLDTTVSTSESVHHMSQQCTPTLRSNLAAAKIYRPKICFGFQTVLMLSESHTADLHGHLQAKLSINGRYRHFHSRGRCHSGLGGARMPHLECL